MSAPAVQPAEDGRAIVARAYLAARFEEQGRLADWRHDLARFGVEVTSRWLDVPREKDRTEVYRQHGDDLARENVEDIARADAIVFLSPREHFRTGRGGRHVEFGIGLALGKRIVLVGERENIFHYSAGVVVLPIDVPLEQIAAAIQGLAVDDVRICGACGGLAATRCFLDLPYRGVGLVSFCGHDCRKRWEASVAGGPRT